jgi:hypothetical protein
MGIEAAIITAGLLAGGLGAAGAVLAKQSQPKIPDQPKAPDIAAPEDSAAMADRKAVRQSKKALAAYGRSDTILTGPQGVGAGQQSAPMGGGGSTLLGG